MTSLLTVSASLKNAATALSQVAGDRARLEAELLHASVLGLDRMRLYLDPTRILDEAEAQAIEGMIARRSTHEPIAYILGEAEFWSLPFRVSKDTLVPRPDTESLVETVLDLVPANTAGEIVDLGTGTGCILLSILSERPGLTGVGVDVIQGAVDLAAENADRLGLTDRARFLQSNWFEGVRVPDDGFDIIVSNPPYIDEASATTLMPDVRDHEPVSALVGGADGLDAYRIIAAHGLKHIGPGGLLALEIGFDQGVSVPAILVQAGWVDIQLLKDLGGNNRVVTARPA